MHHVIMQAQDGPQLRKILEYLRMLGVTRVVFPPREYRSATAGHSEPRESAALYETARLYPRGDDGGFADNFLTSRYS